MHSAQLGPSAPPGPADLRPRTCEPFHMRVVVDELAVDDRRHFIDAVGKQEAAIEYRHASLLFRHILPIHIDNAAHAPSLGRWCVLTNQILAPESMGLVMPP